MQKQGVNTRVHAMAESETSGVHVCDAVRQVKALHPYLADPSYRTSPIRMQLDRQAQTLVEGHRRRDGRVAVQVSNWQPERIGWPAPDILAAGLSEAQSRLAVAREHGFTDWAGVEALGEQRLDASFEDAVDSLLAGRAARLARMLDAQPGLVRARSRFGHRATLLHYLGANGVETWRQKAPANGAALADLLLARGADASARAEMYGGGQTALDLVLTSAHPAEAGTSAAIASVLRAAQQAGRG